MSTPIISARQAENAPNSSVGDDFPSVNEELVYDEIDRAEGKAILEEFGKCENAEECLKVLKKDQGSLWVKRLMNEIRGYIQQYWDEYRDPRINDGIGGYFLNGTNVTEFVESLYVLLATVCLDNFKIAGGWWWFDGKRIKVPHLIGAIVVYTNTDARVPSNGPCYSISKYWRTSDGRDFGKYGTELKN